MLLKKRKKAEDTFDTAFSVIKNLQDQNVDANLALALQENEPYIELSTIMNGLNVSMQVDLWNLVFFFADCQI
jgi:ribosomal protein S7